MNFYLTRLGDSKHFIPYDDSDYEVVNRVPAGEIVKVEYIEVRNYQFHKKYMKLMSVAFDNLPEQYDKQFPTMEALRKAVTVEAGYFDVTYDFDGNAGRTAQSVSYEKMGQIEFEDLYSRSLDILLQKIFIGMTPEEFTKELLSFM